MTILTNILHSLRTAASYNKHELAVPTVILWHDEERLWSHCIELLRERCSLLWTLGEYSPENATGPAVWLRYQLESYRGEEVPVLYLPGIGRAAFRTADQCPTQATHLFALQFQGQFWTQRNGKDWTPFAFLSSSDGGLDLDVAADQDTRRAIQECLPKLLGEELAGLKGRKLEAGDFRAIVIKDPVWTLLQWINNPTKVRQELEISGSEWSSFCARCRDEYQIDPEKDGVITAAEKLTSGKPAWALVWNRFKEAPTAYPGVKKRLESLPPLTLFEPPTEFKPLSNRKEEDRLEDALLSLSTASPRDALSKIKTLASEHAYRTKWVWSVLGESQLAQAITHLAELAGIVESSGNPPSWETLADYYCSTGWKVDRAVLRALNVARSAAATKAVTTAIRAIYLPWLEKFSTLTQALTQTYPVFGSQSCRTLRVEEGTVYLFADGLRVDLARELEAELTAAGFTVGFDFSWSTLPTVTATAKPAWMPLAAKLGGPLEGSGFQSKEQSSGKALDHPRFKQLVTDCGISFLESTEPGSPSGCAWTESGSFDTNGHDQGAKLAWRVAEELKGLKDRICELLQAGWNSVKVITDHGWLMLPGGLPKVELPKHLTVSRWSRCAIPGAGDLHGFPATSWFWDAAETVVLAPGVSCFVAGMEHAHGGLAIVQRQLSSRTVRAGEEELFKTRAKDQGRVKLIDLVKARLDTKNDCFVAELPSVRLNDVRIADDLVNTHDRMLTGGFYAELDLAYDPSIAEEKSGRPFGIESLREIQLSKSDVLEVLCKGRGLFTFKEWKDLLLRSVGLEPSVLGERTSDVMLLRMVPFVENNYNAVELGPRGTGKSHLYQQVSPYAHLVSGGKASVAKMFVDNGNGRRGLVCQFDVVCFDEVSGISFDQKDGVNIMKGYMESGEFSRGKESIRGFGGMVMVGNFDVDVEHQQRLGHLLGPLPPEMRNDTAFMDRIHAYIPGWDVPKVNRDQLTEHFGLVSDFLSSCWNHLRSQSRVNKLQGRMLFGGALSGRDTTATQKTMSGLLKLMYPDPEADIPDESIEWAVRLALECRRRVKEQQKRIGSAEFRNTHFSFTMLPDGIEQFVSTPELHNENSIGNDPLPAGQVWAMSPGGTDENPGLFRIEVNEGPGSGIKILNQSPPGPLKESVRCAEQNLYARAKELVGDRDPRSHEFTTDLVNIWILSL